MAFIRVGLRCLTDFMGCKSDCNILSEGFVKPPKDCPCETMNSFNNVLMSFILDLITLFAIYLAFKCKGRFEMKEFLIAGLFSPIYILYRLAFTNNCKNNLWKM
jgi:hypothetical protein